VRRAFARKLPEDHWLSHRIREQGQQKGQLDFYELRPFFGTAFAHPPAGVRPASPYEIAQQMGHKDGGALATRVYIHTKGNEASWTHWRTRGRRPSCRRGADGVAWRHEARAEDGLHGHR
jgi:hypothetical protein